MPALIDPPEVVVHSPTAAPAELVFRDRENQVEAELVPPKLIPRRKPVTSPLIARVKPDLSPQTDKTTETRPLIPRCKKPEAVPHELCSAGTWSGLRPEPVPHELRSAGTGFPLSGAHAEPVPELVPPHDHEKPVVTSVITPPLIARLKGRPGDIAPPSCSTGAGVKSNTASPKQTHGSPVQAHGFTWETNLLQAVYGLSSAEIKKIPPTHRIDLPGAMNRLDQVDLSIKTSQSPRSVCMASVVGLYDQVTSGHPFHLIVIQYRQVTTCKVLQQLVEIDLTKSVEALFGKLTRADLVALDDLVKKVPTKRSPTPDESAAMETLRQSLHQRRGALQLNIKCNSQQSRLQCSFGAFDQFVKDHPEWVIARGEADGIFRGGQLLTSIESARRVFKKKDKTT